MSDRRYTAIFERDEAGFIYAHVPELPEVQTQGRTLDEAREMIRTAIDQASNCAANAAKRSLARAGP